MDDPREMPYPTGDCPGVEEITAYVDGQVSPQDRRRIEAHMLTCALCRNDVAELFAVIGLLGGLDAAAPRRSFRIGPPPHLPRRNEPPSGPGGLPGDQHGG